MPTAGADHAIASQTDIVDAREMPAAIGIIRLHRAIAVRTLDVENVVRAVGNGAGRRGARRKFTIRCCWKKFTHRMAVNPNAHATPTKRRVRAPRWVRHDSLGIAPFAWWRRGTNDAIMMRAMVIVAMVVSSFGRTGNDCEKCSTD